MWVFRGDSLVHRLDLDETLGWWLDYWLFLHCDDTHPVWCARPLGLRSLARAALASEAPTDWTLRERLKYETVEVGKMSPFIDIIPKLPSIPLVVDGSSWSGAWIEWFSKMAACDPTAIAQNLIGALCAALAKRQTREAAFLSRRLAAELGSEGWSERHLSMTAKSLLLDSGDWAHRPIDQDALAEALHSAFADASGRYYTVIFTVLPVQVTKQIVNTVGRGNRLILEDDGDRLRVTGIKNTVHAIHAEQAVMKSHRVAVSMLENLRLSFYIRSNLYGAARVVEDATGAESWVSLAQPFWTKRQFARKVPCFPPGGFAELLNQLSAHDAARWSAARWHLSQAFAGWSEDVHSSAAKVWQGLEAFAPGNKKALVRVQEVGATYLSSICQEMDSHLKAALFQQRRALFVQKEQHPGNPVLPEFKPALLFDRDTGLLGVTSRRLKRPNSEVWMDARIGSDLALLYALRNKVVHSGIQILPDRMAAYLASVGAEIIFALMNASANGIKKQALPQAIEVDGKDVG